MIPPKELRLVASTRAWHQQIGNLSHGCFQVAGIVPIAMILALLTPFIGGRSNESGHFFLQNTDPCDTHGLAQTLLYELLKCFLTRLDDFGIVAIVSHWYPPGLN